jgi:hypothetical protein
VTKSDLGTIEIFADGGNPTIEQIQSKIAQLCPITCDSDLASNLVLASGFTTKNTYEREVKVKFGGAYGEAITGELTIKTLALKNNQIIYKDALG